MKTVGAFDAKTHLSRLLTEVERSGAGILIRRRGKGVAALMPWREPAGSKGAARRTAILAALKEIRDSQSPRQAERRRRPKTLITEGRKR